MKIIMLTPSFPSYQGDVQSPFVYQLCKTLINLENDVRIVCPSYIYEKYDLDIEFPDEHLRQVV